jgi:hypothetical protein
MIRCKQTVDRFPEIDYSENIRVFVDETASAIAPGPAAGHD